MFSESKMASGPGYITLNIIRVLNVISLLLVVVASWIMLVMTVKTSNFFFFDGVSHFITSTIGLFLIVSECSIFRSYYARYWPMLSPEFGFTFLGMSMIVLGFNILGNLNKGATSVENLGLPMWRVVIAGGIMTSLMGFFNIVATFVFCDSKLGITGRQVRSHGAQVPKDNLKPFSVSSGSIHRSPSTTLPMYTSNEERRKSKFGFKFPIRNSVKAISHPIPVNDEQFAKWDERSSPVAPDIQRPPTALHPAYAQGTASSRYSEVSNMTRF